MVLNVSAPGVVHAEEEASAGHHHRRWRHAGECRRIRAERRWGVRAPGPAVRPAAERPGLQGAHPSRGSRASARLTDTSQTQDHKIGTAESEPTSTPGGKSKGDRDLFLSITVFRNDVLTSVIVRLIQLLLNDSCVRDTDSYLTKSVALGTCEESARLVLLIQQWWFHPFRLACAEPAASAQVVGSSLV